MRSKTGRNLFSLLLVVFAIAGCAGQPPAVDYPELSAVAEARKISAPAYISYTVKGLDSVQCENGTCVMSEADFRQNQHDKRALLDLYKLSHQKEQLRVEAYNTLIEAQAHTDTALARKDRAIQQLEQSLRQERTLNAVKTWIERLLFIGGAWVFGSL